MANSGNILPNGRKKETVLTYRFLVWLDDLVLVNISKIKRDIL
jgi:hypothetical protein